MNDKKYLYVVSFFGLVFIVNTILVLYGLTTDFDNYVYDLVRKLEGSFFDNYFIYVTKLGNVSIITGVVILLVVIFRNRYGLMSFLLAVNSAVTNKVLKHIIRRPRPEVLKLIKQGGYSYPSGHSMIAVSVYGYLLYLVFVKIKNRYLKWFLCIILIILILSIGISRIYVGVHYASDVIGGFTLSLVEFILIVSFSNKKIRGN